MIVFKEELDGECLWVGSADLSHYMGHGWHLVAMAEVETYEPYQEQVNTNGYTEYINKERSVKTVEFLVRRHRDDLLEALKEKAKEHHASRMEAEKKAREEATRTRQLEKELEETQQRLDRNIAYGESCQEGRDEAQGRLRTLERHLGAVRKELGEARWRELVGEKEEG